MANQIPAHMLNAMAINFGSVLSVGEANFKNVFLKLESAGPRTFLGHSSQEIYLKELLDFYSNENINSDGSIISTVNGQLLTISEDSFGELFLFPSDGLAHLAEVKASDVKEMQTLLSADGRKIKVSDPKKELKHEVQLLADIVAKGLLAKAR